MPDKPGESTEQGWSAAPAMVTPRPAADQNELDFWIRTMAVDHRYTAEEIALATGLTHDEVEQARRAIGRDASQPPEGQLRLRPYPGGRHPRTGFLQGAIDPHRETKVSVFTPWDPHSYVVVDVPEAVWSNLGLLYLAHHHAEAPTIWDEQGIALDPLEWSRGDGLLTLDRELPNGIRLGARVEVLGDAVRMEIRLTNGTDQPLTDLRVQNCVLLKGVRGFGGHVEQDQVVREPFVALPLSPARDRWLITGWRPLWRVWANPACPCIHADPQLPDCPPGESTVVQGWLSFYQGTAVGDEIERIATPW